MIAALGQTEEGSLLGAGFSGCIHQCNDNDSGAGKPSWTGAVFQRHGPQAHIGRKDDLSDRRELWVLNNS